MKPAFDLALAHRIETTGIIAVLVIDRVEDAVPLARALISGGVDVMELTLRTHVAFDALKAIKSAVPAMVAGVGTVLRADQVESAVEAGAEFGVAPGFNPRVVEAASAANFPFAPGIATPSEIEAAVEHGCKLLKFFPAETSGGLASLRAMTAPFSHLGLRFVPLGGLNATNIGPYLADPSIAALGGSWLAPRDLVQAGAWDHITSLAAEAVQIIKAARPRN